MDKRVIAINLPQFHPFKENDEWWGKGFTEWTNVTKAKPRFRGHYQPHLPSDTGFYDLRLPEARQMQADMARDAGIYGFCYYHYWFNGKRLMNRPIDEILASGEPDFPFMLCWANENWARNWAGGFQDVLIKQEYSEEDDIAHMKWLCENVFPDKRYIRVDGKPVFAIYRPKLFPNIGETINRWRKVASSYNMELYLIRVESDKDLGPDTSNSFDASMDFQPLLMRGFDKFYKNMISKLLRRIGNTGSAHFNRIYSYESYVNYMLSQPMLKYKSYPCVSPGWDNSPRRVNKSFLAFIGSTPKLYGKWLDDVLTRFEPFSKEENFVFINAWNEWAEGNHLEPDQKWGHQYLDETKKAIDKNI